MTPSQIIALVRDAAIVGALAFILLYVHRADENAAKVTDLKGVTEQLTKNASAEARWQAEASSANTTLAQQLQETAAAVSAQRAPVIVRIPASAGAVPSAPAAAAGKPPAAGGPVPGPRGDSQPGRDVDVRPAVNAFELKYEGALAECRSVLNQWPQ